MANSNNSSSFGFASGESTIVTATQQSSTQQSLRKRQRLSSTPGHVELKSRVRQGGDPPFRKGMAYSGNITSGGTEYFGGPVITLQTTTAKLRLPFYHLAQLPDPDHWIWRSQKLEIFNQILPFQYILAKIA